ncbi:MAG: hypothetical protein ACI4QT_05830 [Kiritimatiellia bacterium]
MNSDRPKMLSTVLEIVGGTITILLFVVMIWLFLIVTPDQFSAECEILQMEMMDECQNK